MTNPPLIWCYQSCSAPEARSTRPVGVCVIGHAAPYLVLRQAVRGSGYVRRDVSVLLGSTLVTLENVWHLTCAPACMMDSSTSLMTSTRIITASGAWLCMYMMKYVGFHCFVAFIVFVFCVYSYCEKGSMRCSSTEMTSFLSDLFYDDDVAPSRGIILVFLDAF